MFGMEPRRSGSTRLATAGIMLLLLLFIVAFASRAGVAHTQKTQPTPGYVNWAMSIFMVLYVLMIPVAIYQYSIQMREWRVQGKKQKSFPARLVRSLGVLALVFGFVALRTFLRHHNAFPTLHAPWLAGGGKGGHGAKAGSNYHPTFQWPVLYVSVVLLLALAAYIWWELKRRKGYVAALREDPTVAEDLAASITDAIADLEAETDARRAVIASYARMEKVFARHGLKRHAAETPVEYLRRILLGLGSRSSPVTALTDLFQQAKFSSHEIDSSMKERAIGALRAIRADLEATA